MDKDKLILHEVDIDKLDVDNPVVDYSDGDIAIIDNVNGLTKISPLYARMNFIILCCKGRIQFNLNDRTLNLYQDEILISAPNVILDNYMISMDFECKILCLSDKIIQGLLYGKIDKWNLFVYDRKTNVIKLSEDDKEQFHYYYGLIRYKMGHQNLPYQRIVMQTIIRAMLLEVCNLFKNQVNNENEANVSHGKVLLNHFLDMLAHSTVKRQSVSKYANELSISSKYLTMICTKYSGKSASDWIEQYTMEDIRYNLIHTDLSIKEISFKLGFASISFFGSYVRKHFGMSPSAFRKSRR